MKARRPVILLTLVLLAGACGGSGSTAPTAPATSRPTSTGTLEIVEPSNGSSLSDPVTLRVTLKGAKLVPTTTTDVVPNEGHLHVTLDGELISMTSGLRQQLPSLAPGTHVLQVEFVASDHAPFDPRVIASSSFDVSR